ncbi:hypothetical protein Caci_6572 [Catenulispora acidiphila DSM 44928]|uniref:G domain-containing protein n=1 Tax=Catenulispora acidiphila (strain DSM 44928 / JCM 14897 / NBRC 102108 / NRRL B-24433 / ID139908) TaxID=479433 RepID=C7PYC8_CATAD|nr:GTPase [Catenulispora acidiphila]ACU75418.1 hypothetical protein Caci_6572 [Catenulispora acidiphila DSM 44928]
MADDNSSTLAILTAIFHDQPELLRAVKLGDLHSSQLLEEVRTQNKLFGGPVRQFAVGRTGAGKTTLGNLLFGAEAMKVTGYNDCTDYIGRVRLKSDMSYFDTPGAGGDDEYENYARMALGLPQLSVPEVTEFRLLDFTNATLDARQRVENVTQTVITADDYEKGFAKKYPPDVLMYVVSPHVQFVRTDREYLQDMLKRYGDRVVIALNRWDGMTAENHVENVRRQIDTVYRHVSPDGSLRPRYAEFNARTGSGMDELTRHICEVIDPAKLGRMQAVLDGSLKDQARKERARHYHRTLDRIAARLALHTVDHQTAGLDLITLAADGVAQYGVLTFEAENEAQEVRDELARHVADEAERVRRERTEDIVTQQVKTGTRDIITQEPVYDIEEKIEYETHRISEQISESTGVGLWKSMAIQTGAAVDRAANWLQGGTQKEREAIKHQARKDQVKITTHMVEKDIQVPVKRYEQKIASYQDKVIATVTEVVGMTDTVVGTRALQGAVPLIELLLSIGHGVERFCVATGERKPIDDYVAAARDQIALELDRVRRQLDQLIERGAPAEQQIADLLDSLFAK